MDRLEDAEAAFREEIAAFPAHAEPYASLAVIRFMKRDLPGLDKELNEMVRANPSPRSYLLAATPSIHSAKRKGGRIPEPQQGVEP